MKKTLLSLFALMMAMSVNAQMITDAEARVYAYDLQQNDLTLTFKTNTKANTATVIFTAEGQDNVEVAASSTDGKNWTAEIAPSQEFAADVDYNWSVKVSADPVTEFAQINQDGVDFSFFRSYGIAIDNNPESDNFGRIYVANSFSGTARSNSYSKSTTAGIYTFSPQLDPENGASAYTCSAIGDSDTSGGSPRDLNIDEEGTLYLADYSKANSGVYVVNPNENYSSAAIFDGARDTDGRIWTSENKLIAKRTCAVGVRGTGTDREIYTIQDDTTNVYSVCRFEIGDAENWAVEPTWKASTLYNSTLNTDTPTKVQVVNGYSSIEPVSTGGYWIAQYRGTSSKENPSVFYCNSNNEVLYSAEENGNMTGTGSRNGALAVNENLGLVAFSLGAKTGLLSYTMKSDENIEASAISTYAFTTIGRADAMAFDYAGNLYAVTASTEAMAVFALPTDENTCTTPAKKSLTVSFSEDQLTGVEEIGVENAPVEYYNLQGVKVENPSNGVFIKKQGGKAVKVVL